MSQLAQIDWIDVNYKVPSDARFVLCWSVDGRVHVGKLLRQSNHSKRLWRNFSGIISSPVTHWAHLQLPSGMPTNIPFALAEVA